MAIDRSFLIAKAIEVLRSDDTSVGETLDRCAIMYRSCLMVALLTAKTHEDRAGVIKGMAEQSKSALNEMVEQDKNLTKMGV